MRNFLILLTLLLVACHNTTLISEPKKMEEDTVSDTSTDKPPVIKEEPEVNLDSVRQKILKDNLKSNHSDKIVYVFSLEGDYSLEGNEGKAFYINNQIKKIAITFYRESGKSVYTYAFGNDKIMVEEKRHGYDVPLSGNIISTEVVRYKIDYAGKIVESDNKEIDLDTYFILKKSIPFKLK